MPAMPDPSNPARDDVPALVARAQLGDAPAFRELFRGHAQGVHRLVHRLAAGVIDVDDVVQTVFVEAFRSLGTYRGDALFSTWLARIALRVTMHAVRRRPPRALSLDGDALEDANSSGRAGPEQTVAARESLAHVNRLLAALRTKPRVAFVMHVLEGYSIEEIASMVGASQAAVKVRIHDARRAIERQVMRDPSFTEWLKPGRRA
jgi:RNA polymerase sigma-70 factor (ECF subfamily)